MVSLRHEFMLSYLRQRLLAPAIMPKVEQRLRELAARQESNQDADEELVQRRARLIQVQSQLKTVCDNMPLAKTPEQYEVIAAKFEQMKAQEALLETEIVAAESKAMVVPDIEGEIAGAMNILHRLTDLATGPSSLELAAEAFQFTNARLFLRFRAVQVKKRLLNKLSSGVVVFGAAPNPIDIYRGPTGRRALNYNGSIAIKDAEPGKLSLPSPPEVTVYSGSEGNSLRNVNRGERI